LLNSSSSGFGPFSDISDLQRYSFYSSRGVFKVSRLGHYNCRIPIVGVGMQQRGFSPDRPAVNSAGWNHFCLTADTSLRPNLR
jgi:hypothetical protein